MNGSREFRRRQRQLGAKYDTFGNKLTWFGYKVHLAVDAKSELPIALDVTPANVYDGEMAIPLMKEIHERNWRFQFVMMDAGYDQAKNGEAARQYGAQAIIALNKRGEKEPPIGIASDGTLRCSMGYDAERASHDERRARTRHPEGHDPRLHQRRCSTGGGFGGQRGQAREGERLSHPAVCLQWITRIVAIMSCFQKL
ncbi:transposase [Alicyclobacillus sacchari]|uniref:transposase n=1 Tax=Alicyclobacillus sacchari TaxID=392010 RepID=UPI00312CB863